MSMSISNEGFKKSVEALNTFSENLWDKDGNLNRKTVYRLCLVKDKNGETILKCYDKNHPIKPSSLMGKIAYFFHYHPLVSKEVEKFCHKHLGTSLAEINTVAKSKEELLSDTSFADRHYYSNLSTSARKEYHKLEHTLTKLEMSQDQEKSYLQRQSQKINSSLKELWRASPFFLFTKEYNEFVLTQHNLSDRGGFSFTQKGVFLDLIKGKEGAEFEELRQGIKEMQTLERNVVAGALPFGKDLIAKQLKSQFDHLGVGDNMWLDLGSCQGRHSMKGRIKQIEENKYIFQMANTGCGLSENSDIHPSLRDDKTGKVLYQTVIEWGPFEKDVMTKDFFKRLLEATVDGKQPEGVDVVNLSENVEGKYQEIIPPILSIYSVIRQQFKENNVPLAQKEYNAENANYWSPEQIGPTCVPNSFWSLARATLTHDQLQELKTDARIRYLQRNYKTIASGKDQSYFSLIQASEQARVLQRTQENQGLRTSNLIQKITQDLVSRGGQNLEMQLINRNGLDMSNLPEKTTLREAILRKNTGNASINVDFQTLPIEISLQRNGLAAGAYLLYEAVLTGDESIIKESFERFEKEYNKDINNIQVNLGELNALAALTQLFDRLSFQFQNLDGSLPAREKQLMLMNVSKTLYTIVFKNFITDAEIKKNEYYINFIKDVGKELTENLQNALDFYRLGDTGTLKSVEPESQTIWSQISRRARPWDAYGNHSFSWTGYAKQATFYLNQQNAPELNKRRVIKTSEEVDLSNIQLRSFYFAGESKGRGPITATLNKPEIEKTLPSDSLVAKAYLAYFNLCSGNDVGQLDQFRDEKLNEEDKEALIWIAGKLVKASGDLRILDSSAESFESQKKMIKIAGDIYAILGQFKPLADNFDNIKNWGNYYSAARPQDYIY